MLNQQDPPEASRRSSARKVVLILGCLMACLSLATAVRSYYQPRKHSVYACYYIAGNSWREQDNLYNKADMAQGIDLFRYYPTFAAGMAPWTLLPEALSGATWRLTWGLALTGALVLTLLEASGKTHPTWLAMAGIAWVACALTSMNNGQVNVPITAALVLATLAAERKKALVCGMLVAVAIVTKVAPVAYAGLFALILPWRMGLACLGTTGLLVALPYLLAPAEYVREQVNSWLSLLRQDDRHNWAIKDGYRDLWMLWRQTGLPTNRDAYQVMQLAGGALLAIPVWWFRKNLPSEKAAQLCYGLASAWLLLLGPSAESSTYILMGPWLGWAILEAGKKKFAWVDVLLVATGLCLILAALGGSLKYAAQWHALGWHPISALFLLAWELISLPLYWSKRGIPAEASPA